MVEPVTGAHAVELPSGAVTFCFTDIESSTRLFRSLGDAYEDVLETQRRLIRQTFDAAGGVEVRAIGDGLFFAFGNASKALSACLDAQRSLISQTWPTDAAVRVRIGLHTGEAVPRSGDYVSLAVHQAARVADTANGGQTVISAATVDALDPRLDRPCEIIPLGRYRLKDFDESVALFELGHPELAPSRPLRARPAATPSLPVPATRLVGRERELAEIADLLQTSPLLTLVGPGGVGKTRTAVEAATRMVPVFPEGVWFVDLAAVDEGAGVLPAIAHATAPAGSPVEGNLDLVDALVDRVDGICLLVVDNCEHLLDAVADALEILLARSPDLRILATSREPLRAADEQVYRLPPLSLPSATGPAELDDLLGSEAVRLFLGRAARADPRFALTSESAEDVRAVVLALDGLPLAVELAAARVDVLPPALLLRRLQEHLGPLPSVQRRASARHSTLEATVAWSVDLLAPGEAHFFASLAVFPGTFSEQAALAVCGAVVEATPALLSSLTDKSLVVAERGPEGAEYRLLGTTRTCALLHLDRWSQEDQTRLRDSHFSWCHRTAADWRAAHEVGRRSAWSEDWRSALDWGVRTGGKVDDCLRLALALARLLDREGRWAEGKPLLDEAASLGGAEDLQTEILRCLGAFDRAAGRYETAAKVSDEALRRARAIGDRRLEARCLIDLAHTANRHTGDYGTAAKRCEDALLIAQTLADRALEALCFTALGNIATGSGDLETSRRHHEAALAATLESGDQAHLATTLNNLAYAALLLGDAETAMARSEEAIALAGIRGDQRTRAYTLDTLGSAAASAGDADRATDCFHEALSIALGMGDRYLQAYATLGLARIARGAGHADEHVALLLRAFEAGSLNRDRLRHDLLGEAAHAMPDEFGADVDVDPWDAVLEVLRRMHTKAEQRRTVHSG